MSQDVFKGVIYIKFEDRDGPNPILHVPSDLSHDIVKKVNKRCLNLIKGNEIQPDSLESVSLEIDDLMGFMIYREWEMKEFYGGVLKTVLILFLEQQDGTLLEHESSFRPAFEEYGKRLIELEKSEAEKSEYLELLRKFKEKANLILADL